MITSIIITWISPISYKTITSQSDYVYIYTVFKKKLYYSNLPYMYTVHTMYFGFFFCVCTEEINLFPLISCNMCALIKLEPAWNSFYRFLLFFILNVLKSTFYCCCFFKFISAPSSLAKMICSCWVFSPLKFYKIFN